MLDRLAYYLAQNFVFSPHCHHQLSFLGAESTFCAYENISYVTWLLAYLTCLYFRFCPFNLSCISVSLKKQLWGSGDSSTLSSGEVLATKPDNWSAISRTCVVEGENPWIGLCLGLYALSKKGSSGKPLWEITAAADLCQC